MADGLGVNELLDLDGASIVDAVREDVTLLVVVISAGIDFHFVRLMAGEEA